MNRGGKTKKELVGKLAEVASRISPGKVGVAEIQTEDGHFRLNATAEGNLVMEKGEQVLLLEFDPDKDLYLVAQFDIPVS